MVKNQSSPREQILLVEGINVGFGILFGDTFDIATSVCSKNAVEGNDKQVMEANKLLKAFERWWEMKDS